MRAWKPRGKTPRWPSPLCRTCKPPWIKVAPIAPQQTCWRVPFPISNEILDFGLTVNRYLKCVRPQSFVCDPAPGGLQEQIAPALAASGEERMRLMQAFGD